MNFDSYMTTPPPERDIVERLHEHSIYRSTNQCAEEREEAAAEIENLRSLLVKVVGESPTLEATTTITLYGMPVSDDEVATMRRAVQS